jgi:hypothetical protein
LNFRAQIDTEAARRAIQRAPGRFRSRIEVALKEHGQFFQERMEARMSRPWSEYNPTDVLSRRSGALISSLNSKVVGKELDGLQLQGTVGDGRTRNYVFAQEYGAVIRPKRAKYLTIPASGNYTAGGRVRYESLGALISAKGDQVIKKGLGIFLRTGKSERSDKPMFWLSKGPIRIPDRLGFGETWRSSRLNSDRRRRIKNAVNDAVAAINGGR